MVLLKRLPPCTSMHAQSVPRHASDKLPNTIREWTDQTPTMMSSSSLRVSALSPVSTTSRACRTPPCKMLSLPEPIGSRTNHASQRSLRRTPARRLRASRQYAEGDTFENTTGRISAWAQALAIHPVTGLSRLGKLDANIQDERRQE